MPRDDPKSMQEARWIDAESNTTKTRCHGATVPRCQTRCQTRRCQTRRCHEAKRDANVQRDDATRRCRLNATMQSQGRYETRQSLTRRRLDATMTNATMPRCQYATSMFSVTMLRDDADCQCSRHMHGLTMGPCMMRVDTDCQCMKTTTPINNATVPRCQTRRCHETMPTQCHEAESRHEDDVDWLLHDDTNPC